MTGVEVALTIWVATTWRGAWAVLTAGALVVVFLVLVVITGDPPGGPRSRPPG